MRTDARFHGRVRRVVEAAAHAELHARSEYRRVGDFDLEERQLVEFPHDEGVRDDLGDLSANTSAVRATACKAPRQPWHFLGNVGNLESVSYRIQTILSGSNLRQIRSF